MLIYHKSFVKLCIERIPWGYSQFLKIDNYDEYLIKKSMLKMPV